MGWFTPISSVDRLNCGSLWYLKWLFYKQISVVDDVCAPVCCKQRLYCKPYTALKYSRGRNYIRKNRVQDCQISQNHILIAWTKRGSLMRCIVFLTPARLQVAYHFLYAGPSPTNLDRRFSHELRPDFSLWQS